MSRESSSYPLVCLGVITGAMGVQGEVRIKPFTAKPEGIAAYGKVQTEDGSQRFEIKRTRPIKQGVAAKLVGVNDRNSAEALKGTMLYVSRAQLPDDVEEDEFYYTDLVGLKAILVDGQELGMVTAVHDFGAGDLLEVALTATNKTVLIPFTRQVVPEVDMDAQKVIVDPPEGLMSEPKRGETS